VAERGADDVVAAARAVLDRNRRGEWTCPSVVLYPHQWLWDSCFTAIGIARYDPERAAGELRALFRGQWANGMLPHMLFAPGSRDIGSRRVWQSHRHADAPRDVATSCITQPPMVAIAAERVAHALGPDARAAFVADVLPRIVAHHQWCYRERDLDASGLITLIHPWECGLDSTPPWMDALCEMRLPLWLRAAERVHLSRLLRSLRYDTRLLPASERASDDEGLRMLALAVHTKHYDFELRRIPRDDRVVLHEDLAFNSLLVVANAALARMADEHARVLPDGLVASTARTRVALETLWDDASGTYCSRDAVSARLVRSPTIATFLPLWAGTPDDGRVARLLASLQTAHGSWPAFPVPSVPLDAAAYQETRYWKGPTWVNTNWAIVQGLRAQGADALADELRARTLAMVHDHGFAEYFSARTGEPHGARDFSWTAALTIDLAMGGAADAA